ncbi:hypothetical protein YN1_3920 [Nanoarchaeota archaeon]
MRKRGSLAPLVLLVSIIILLIFAFYYLTSQVNSEVLDMEYLSEDYASYQKALYYIFVYVPFEIRYNLVNLILTNLYSNGNTYNINNILVNTNYYSTCQIPFVENLNQNGDNSFSYSLCIPLLYVENCQNNNPTLFVDILNNVQQSLGNIKDSTLSFSGFSEGQCQYYLENVQYNFTIENEYSRVINFGNINYPFYSYELYYDYIISYLYNQTYGFFNYVINNQSNFSTYSNYIYYNQTQGDNVYLNLSFNNNAYYVLDLYYNTLLPLQDPNMTNITIVLPCEAFGQLYNGNCIANQTLENYQYECLYTKSENLQYLFSKLKYKLFKQKIFDGYWYNITSINYQYSLSNLPPDFLDCSNTINFAEKIVGNYTYFTGGDYPVLVPVNIQVNYNNISCSIKNQIFQFGPFSSIGSCDNEQNIVDNILISNNVNNCIMNACTEINNNYYFNLTCNDIVQTQYLNSFNYNYQIYEWFNINDKNINNFCSSLQ